MKIALSLVLPSVFALPAFAQDGAHGPDAWRVVDVQAGDVLNLRAGPSTDHPVIGRLAPDARGIASETCVPLLDMQTWQRLGGENANLPSRWCLVRWNGQRGWANQRYLGEDVEPVRRSDRGGDTTPSADGADPYATAPALAEDFLRLWARRGPSLSRGELERYLDPYLADEFAEDRTSDPVFGGQDREIAGIRTSWSPLKTLRGTTFVTARYTNFGTPREMELRLRPATALPGAPLRIFAIDNPDV